MSAGWFPAETPRGVLENQSGANMTDQQIIDLFDSSNITLRELAAISGRSVADLKVLLMGGA
jgi:hypothetical protein